MIEEHHIRCDETQFGNDVAFSFKCGVYAKDIAVIDKPFFIITEREGTLAASQFTKQKKTAKEYTIRLGVLLNICKFIDDEQLDVGYLPYRSYSYAFMHDYPREFWNYYFKVMLPRYFKLAWKTPVYFCYFALFGVEKRKEETKKRRN